MARPAIRQTERTDRKPAIRIKTTLWELIENIQDQTGPDADALVVNTVADLLAKGRILSRR